MKEQTWILGPGAELHPGRILRIDSTEGPCTLNPLGYEHSDGGPVSLVMQVRPDGNVDLYDGEKLALEGIPCLFVAMDSVIQASVPETATAICRLYEGTNLLEDAVTQKNDSYMVSIKDPRYYQVLMNRIGFRVTCHAGSQLSFELHDDRCSNPHSGLALDHCDGYVNVWRDIYVDGIWSHGKRQKVGFFKYEIGKPYTLTIVVTNEGGPHIRCCVSSPSGGFKVLTPVSCESSSCEWISLRESYCRGSEAGVYEIDVL